MPMAGPNPVVRSHDNYLDADCPIDQDELLDYADQGPLPFPTATAGHLSRVLSGTAGARAHLPGPLPFTLRVRQPSLAGAAPTRRRCSGGVQRSAAGTRYRALHLRYRS